MTLYERVASIPSGGRALAVSRLRSSVLAALHKAFRNSGLESQADLAKHLKVRRSAVNQVFRGDGNVRVNTLAEYLYEMGYEVDITLVKAGEPRKAVVQDRAPVPAFPVATASSSTSYWTFPWQATEAGSLWAAEANQGSNLLVIDANVNAAFVRANAAFGVSKINVTVPAAPSYNALNMSPVFSAAKGVA